MRAAKYVAVLLVSLSAAGASAEGKRGSGWVAPALAADLAEELKAGLAEADAAYGIRERKGESEKALGALRELAKKSPDAFDVNWRLARAAFWAAESTKDAAKKQALAIEGRDAGRKAIAARPKSADGHYWSALCIGEYSHSIGILTALGEGVEAQFRDPLLEAEKLDAKIDHGGVFNALGRYKFELPWPKRDVEASITYLRKGIEVNPQNLRARVYLADSLAKRDGTGDLDEAKTLVRFVLAASPGRYDPAEEYRAQEFARALVKAKDWKLE